jgi:hypothetical protein
MRRAAIDVLSASARDSRGSETPMKKVGHRSTPNRTPAVAHAGMSTAPSRV